MGRKGEALAADYLAQKGWEVLARNYRAGSKEIDLIVSKNGAVAFVEVKTRATTSGGTPMEAVTRAKMQAVEAAAHRWIHEHGEARAVTYRFDVISIELVAGRATIQHFADAWRPTTSHPSSC